MVFLDFSFFFLDFSFHLSEATAIGERKMSPPLLIIITLLNLLSVIHSRPATSLQFPLSVTVTDFGATADGIHYDTAAIQSAIDACHCSSATKPCYVTFPPGKYLTATVFLKSGVVLNVEEGATILGGPRLEDYPRESFRWYVILAEGASNVGITGGGVVDGQGLKFVERFEERKNVMVSWNQTGACSGDECRPRLIGFLGCNNVTVWNVKLNQPAYWWSVHFTSFSF